jgi:hypothetical protein
MSDKKNKSVHNQHDCRGEKKRANGAKRIKDFIYIKAPKSSRNTRTICIGKHGQSRIGNCDLPNDENYFQ